MTKFLSALIFVLLIPPMFAGRLSAQSEEPLAAERTGTVTGQVANGTELAEAARTGG